MVNESWPPAKIKWYYSDKRVAIAHGDCKEVLPQLKAKSVDLILTDPPYGIKYHSRYYIGRNPFEPIIGDDHYPIEILPELRRITRKAIFMFCRWDKLVEIGPPKSFIAMIKNNWTAGDLKGGFGRQWEGILFYPCEDFQFNTRLPDVIDCRRVLPNALLHPTQKPEYPCRLLIQECSLPGDIILDPFLGSGTTLVCAKTLGRRAIGIEIEERYCEIAANRCSQEVMEL